jgi:DNA-binding transcriptional LysR family regulator
VAPVGGVKQPVSSTKGNFLFMETRDLEVYLTIAQEKNMTRAAKKLYMSPQGLSKIIRKIEDELECSLFVRVAHGIELTESGLCLQEYATHILNDFWNAKSDIMRIEQRQNLVVDLLSSYGIIRLLTPDCLLNFQEKHPDITLRYREYPDLRVEEYFSKQIGNVAFSIGGFEESVQEENDIAELASLPLRLLVPADHPLCQKKSVTINDLRTEKLFIENEEFKLHHMILDRCHRSGFEPDIVFEAGGFSLCHKMTSQGKGISFTVDFVFEDMKSDNLRTIPFSDAGFEWKVCMLTRKKETENPAVQQFRKHVEEWLEGLRSGRISR